MKTVGIVTGSRAEYGYLRPLIRAVQKSDLKLRLYVTGMHLLKATGHTVDDVERDGFPIFAKILMGSKPKRTPYEVAESIGKGVENFAKSFKESSPDMLIVFGDRIESFAAAVAAASMNIPLAHIGGGDVGLGDIDDSLRHAITKLAHLHFTSTEKSKERVLKLGEEPWRVHCVGALSLDSLNNDISPWKRLAEKYGLNGDKTMLVVFHPTTTEWEDAGKQVEAVLEAVLQVAGNKYNVVLIQPNDYPGGDEIRKAALECRRLFIFDSLPHEDFISLMKSSSVLVGNTSSGIIEAPSLGVPYVCVGTRQEGRERADNVIDVGYDPDEIKRGILKALTDGDFLKKVDRRQTPYWSGGASEKIVEILKNTNLDGELLKKKLSY
jgi:GDP/UDP-N,N'-diacetylbacillosamine 2-epimerase (hydrolysing)